MGEVKEKIKLTNFVDFKNCENNIISNNEVRKAELEMLVDTGATMLMISEDVAEKLGIAKEKEIMVSLADGSIQKHFKGRGVLVEIGERDCVTDCIILEKGDESHLGKIPLLEMDLVVDYQNNKLIPNPNGYNDQTIIRI